jgi:hypothetical protein
MLGPEGGVCSEYEAAGRRIILAVGHEVDKDTGEPIARAGVPLREETMALLWACLLSRGDLAAQPNSPLYHLPCHWVGADDSQSEKAGEQLKKRGNTLLPVLHLLDSIFLLKPESAVCICIGDNSDDASPIVAFVGIDEHDGEKRAILFQDWWLKRLWETLLLGPGAYFANENSPLHDAIRTTDAEQKGEERE